MFSLHRYVFNLGTGKKKLLIGLVTELVVEMNLCSEEEQIWCCSAQKLSELFTEAGVTLKSWVMGNSLFSTGSGRVTYTKQNSRLSRKGLLSPKRGCKQNLLSTILGILWSLWDHQWRGDTWSNHSNHNSRLHTQVSTRAGPVKWWDIMCGTHGSKTSN